MRKETPLPEDIENHRDRMWRREPEARVEDASGAERFIEEVGFCAAMTDARRPGPSLYVAVCGRRDAHMPRNVQKDPEASLTWVLKDEVMRRGRVYYGKLAKGRATFVASRLIPYFNALWGLRRSREREVLSADARAILKVLRREWEMATGDLRESSGIAERARFTRALDELQRTLKVIPGDVVYQPWFTYIWTLPEARFATELSRKVTRDEALCEIARAFLHGAGMTVPGELAKVTGLSRPDAGRGNHQLVAEGYAERLGVGVYRIKGGGS
ncbi:MAG: hypothetical protein QOJ64_1806 [Acidobacteriota bacterium]|jgi:hypothetical protein|nr:hypothetical protein [Acidobacteriota bacterium]